MLVDWLVLPLPFVIFFFSFICPTNIPKALFYRQFPPTHSKKFSSLSFITYVLCFKVSPLLESTISTQKENKPTSAPLIYILLHFLMWFVNLFLSPCLQWIACITDAFESGYQYHIFFVCQAINLSKIWQF